MPNRKVDENYLSDFIFMAEKGLYTFDKTLLNELNDNKYHLVVSPVVALTTDDLPLEILNILSQTIITTGINKPMDISSFL